MALPTKTGTLQHNEKPNRSTEISSFFFQTYLEAVNEKPFLKKTLEML